MPAIAHQFRHRQPDIQNTPVLGDPLGLERGDLFTRQQPAGEVVLLFNLAGGCEAPDVHLQRLGLAVPIHQFRTAVPGGEPSRKVLDRDRIIRVPHHRRHTPEVLFRPLALHGVSQRAGENIAAGLALDQVVLGALPYRDQGHVLVRVSCQYDQRQPGRRFPQPVQGVQPLAVGQPQVSQNYVNAAGRQADNRLGKTRHDLNLEARRTGHGQRLANQVCVGLIVFDQKDPAD